MEERCRESGSGYTMERKWIKEVKGITEDNDNASSSQNAGLREEKKPRNDT
jgi:hypothetical protein